LVAAVVLLVPLLAGWVPAASAENGPPLSQPLVREGDLAMDLALDLGLSVESEAEAESKLASMGIEPRNGWISDYPVTPDILSEIHDAVGDAADSGKLGMSKGEALALLTDISIDYGLSVRTTSDGSPPPVREAAVDPYYNDPSLINDYYTEYGPAVVTYYTPPWDYYSLYSWVPYPFWWSGIGFSGYFILNDFHRRVVVVKKRVGHPKHWRHKGRFEEGKVRTVSNRVVDRNTGITARLDPVTRTIDHGGRSVRNISNPRSRAGLESGDGRRDSAPVPEGSLGRPSRGNAGARGTAIPDRWNRPASKESEAGRELRPTRRPNPSGNRERLRSMRPKGPSFAPNGRRSASSGSFRQGFAPRFDRRSWSGNGNRAFGTLQYRSGSFRGSGGGGNIGPSIGRGFSGGNSRIGGGGGFSGAGRGGFLGGSRGGFSGGHGRSGGGGRR